MISGSVQQADAPLTTCGAPRNLANVVNMGVGFLLVFTAFQTVQGLAAKLLGDLGTTSLGILYVAFAGFGFVAPSVARALGPRGSAPRRASPPFSARVSAPVAPATVAASHSAQSIGASQLTQSIL